MTTTTNKMPAECIDLNEAIADLVEEIQSPDGFQYLDVTVLRDANNIVKRVVVMSDPSSGFVGDDDMGEWYAWHTDGFDVDRGQRWRQRDLFGAEKEVIERYLVDFFQLGQEINN